MSFKWVKIAFKKNKVVLYLLVIIITYETIDALEDYILDNVALISREPEIRVKLDPGNISCPYIPNYGEDRLQGQDATFYWTDKQIQSIQLIQYNIPFFTLLFGGIFSDRFGGQSVIFAGLMLCSLVMSTCYLFMFDSNYIFLAMLFLRKSSKGMLWGAFISLGGKLAKQDQRSIFVSVLLAGESFGFFISHVLSAIIVKWKPISLFCGCLSFVTATWWWFIYRSSKFPKVRKIKHIPWKTVATTVSFYEICFLLISCYLIMFLASTEYTIYGSQVLFSKVNHEWVHWLVICLTLIFSSLFCGFSSDYMISKGYLPASAVRRIFYSLCIFTLFCTLGVIKLAKCNRIVVVACSIPLYFASAVAWSTTMSAAIDLSPMCSGAVTGVVFMFSLFVYFPFFSTLRNLFVSGDSKSDINSWIGLLFTLAFLSFVFSLLFICGGLRETSPSIEVSFRRQNTISELDDPTVPASAQVGQQQTLRDTNPGPSKR